MKIAKYLLAVFFFLLFAWMIAGCGVKSQYITSAKIYLGYKPPDYDKAEEQLSLELKNNPDNAEAHYILGYIYSEKNRYKEMTEQFNACLRLSNQWANDIKNIRTQEWATVFNSGVSYMNQDSLEKALDRFENAMIIDSSRYESWLNSGVVALKMNDCPKALGYQKAAYQLKPDDVKVSNTYASTAFSCKEYTEALKIYQKLKEIDPQNVNTLINMATIYEQLAMHDSALAEYSQIINVDPTYRDAYFNRGILYWNTAQGIYKELVALKDSMEQNPSDKKLVERSKELIEKQKELFSKTEQDYKKVMELDPQDKEALELLAFSLISQDKTDEAIIWLEKLVQLDPNNKAAWNSLSIVYTKKGLKEKAREAVEKAKGP
jgi:tetratricopeptide (TPR) repeat protein